MSIPGVFPRNLPEGNYTANGPIWLVGQRDGDANQSKKFNAANLPFNGSGGGNAGLNGTEWFTLPSGDPNGVVSAGRAGDLTLVEEFGWVWRANGSGTMSWANEGFSLKGPPGAGNGGANQGSPSDLVGIVFGNGTALSAYDPALITIDILFGAYFVQFPTNLGGMYWAGAGTLIDSAAGFTAFGTADGPSFGIRESDAYGVALVGFEIGNGNVPFKLGDYPSVVNVAAGQLGYTTSNNTVAYYDGTVWQTLSAGGVVPVNTMAYQGDWNGGPSYTTGQVVHHDGSMWVVINGPTVAGDQPIPEDGIWGTFEEAFYVAFVQPGWFSTGILQADILGFSNAPGNCTYSGQSNGTAVITDIDSRLLALEAAIMNLSGKFASGLASKDIDYTGADNITVFTMHIAEGLVTSDNS